MDLLIHLTSKPILENWCLAECYYINQLSDWCLLFILNHTLCAVLWPLYIYQQRHPHNLIFLGLFTACLSVTVGVACANTDGNATSSSVTPFCSFLCLTFKWDIRRENRAWGSDFDRGYCLCPHWLHLLGCQEGPGLQLPGTSTVCWPCWHHCCWTSSGQMALILH